MIELMIVVGIIAIIAAIAIPNLLRSKIATNETAAIASLRTIASAQSGYKLSVATDANGNGIGEYGTLGGLTGTSPEWLEGPLGSGRRSGYNFQVTLTGIPSSDEDIWEATAFPINPGLTGIRTFYTDESGIIRGSDIGGLPVLRAVAVATFPTVNP